MKKILDELNGLVADSKKANLEEALTLENLSNLNYLQLCISEAMRFEAPLTRSTSMMMTEDTDLGSFTLKAGDIFIIDMWGLHRNKDQW